MSTLSPQAIVVAFTGAFGSGWTTAAAHLRDTKAFSYIPLSQALRSKWKADNPGKEPERADLQRLGDKLREEKGSGVLVDIAMESLARDGKNNEVSRLAIDGIRNLGEIERLRDAFGYRFTLVAIHASPDARWARIGRTAYTDKGLTKRHFVEDDTRDADEELRSGQQVNLCVDKADLLIDNSVDVTLTSYLQKVTEYIELITGEKPRSANTSEILMNMAFAASHSSKCRGNARHRTRSRNLIFTGESSQAQSG